MWVLADAFDGLMITKAIETYRVDGNGMLRTIFSCMMGVIGSVDGVRALEWLAAAELGDLYLYDMDGHLLPASTWVTGVDTRRKTVADVLTWKLIGRGAVVVKSKLTRRRHGSIPDLTQLLRALITNYPSLLTQRYEAAEVRMLATPFDHPLTATLDEGRRLEMTASVGCTLGQTIVDSHGALTQTLSAMGSPEVKIHYVHPHIHLSRMTCLWIGKRRWPHARRHYKQYIAHASQARGRLQKASRAARWKTKSTAAAEGLENLEWKRIRRVLGLGPWGEQVLFRLKSRAYSMYDLRNGKPGCPHAECVHIPDVDLYHVFWTCPAASRLRATFVHQWGALGLRDIDIEAACFGLQLPDIPTRFWEVSAARKPGMRKDADRLDEYLTLLVDGCWRLGAALSFHATWRWRVQHFDDTNDVTERHHTNVLASRLRSGYHTMHNHIPHEGHGEALTTAAAVVSQLLLTKTNNTPTALQASGSSYLMFFDGGSRGNPGPGGAGAVVVRIAGAAGGYQLIWAGSMSYAAATTTNNLAEHMGLTRVYKRVVDLVTRQSMLSATAP